LAGGKRRITEKEEVLIGEDRGAGRTAVCFVSPIQNRRCIKGKPSIHKIKFTNAK
jgi:hypothetical protein